MGLNKSTLSARNQQIDLEREATYNLDRIRPSESAVAIREGGGIYLMVRRIYTCYTIFHSYR
jgi:hypothetical protein